MGDQAVAWEKVSNPYLSLRLEWPGCLIDRQERWRDNDLRAWFGLPVSGGYQDCLFLIKIHQIRKKMILWLFLWTWARNLSRCVCLCGRYWSSSGIDKPAWKDRLPRGSMTKRHNNYSWPECSDTGSVAVESKCCEWCLRPVVHSMAIFHLGNHFMAVTREMEVTVQREVQMVTAAALWCTSAKLVWRRGASNCVRTVLWVMRFNIKSNGIRS
jgi:hypothetical protein